MSASTVEMEVAFAENVPVTADTLSVELHDGRTLAVPLAWYPRLLHASAEERKYWRLIARGRGIHWKNLEEDISVAGRPSGESQVSFMKWLVARSSRPARYPFRRR